MVRQRVLKLCKTGNDSAIRGNTSPVQTLQVPNPPLGGGHEQLTHGNLLSKGLEVSRTGGVAGKSGSCSLDQCGYQGELPGCWRGPYGYSAPRSGIRQNHEPKRAGPSSHDNGSETCSVLHNPSAMRDPDPR